MPTETRRQRQRRELVTEIITVARLQLETGGPSTVSLRGIARQVGLSAPSLYTYFPSLADLFTELIVQSYASLSRSIESTMNDASEQPLGQRLLAGPRAYRRWALEHRQQFNLVFFDQIAGYKAPENGPTVAAQEAVLRPIAAPYAEALGLSVAELQEPGETLDGFLGWWGGFHGLVVLEVNHHLDWVDAERVFERQLRADVQRILS